MRTVIYGIYAKDVIYACGHPSRRLALRVRLLRMRAEIVEAPQPTAALILRSMGA
jgi:hypothetical protein